MYRHRNKYLQNKVFNYVHIHIAPVVGNNAISLAIVYEGHLSMLALVSDGHSADDITSNNKHCSQFYSFLASINLTTLIMSFYLNAWRNYLVC